MSSSSHILYPQPQGGKMRDKISKLPDDILLDVLLLLDSKHAAQTCVLAKRWKYLSTRLTALNLHLAPPNFNYNGYINWVNQVLDAHRAPCITKCRFYVRYLDGTDPSLVEKWARFALSKRVMELELSVFNNFKCPRFSLGFDILKHPAYYNAILNLKSLRLSNIDITGEALEFILSQCRLLEVLDVIGSETLHTLNLVSNKLKHLTLITHGCLRELRIDAVNLISFRHNHRFRAIFHDARSPPHFVFNRLSKLVDMSLEAEICRFPFPILRQLSCLFNQLTRLSLWPIDIERFDLNHVTKCSDIGLGFDVLLPNVKHLTLSVPVLEWGPVIFIKFFIKACPVLHELKLQVLDFCSDLKEEAEQLKEVELENEIIDDMSEDENPYSQAEEQKVIDYVVGEENGRNESCSNLKALEFVGFHGWDSDVELILYVIAGANCLQTLVCDPRCLFVIGRCSKFDEVARTEEIRRRACKLGKLLSRGVRVGVRDMNGLLWISQN